MIHSYLIAYFYKDGRSLYVTDRAQAGDVLKEYPWLSSLEVTALRLEARWSILYIAANDHWILDIISAELVENQSQASCFLYKKHRHASCIQFPTTQIYTRVCSQDSGSCKFGLHWKFSIQKVSHVQTYAPCESRIYNYVQLCANKVNWKVREIYFVCDRLYF